MSEQRGAEGNGRNTPYATKTLRQLALKLGPLALTQANLVLIF